MLSVMRRWIDRYLSDEEALLLLLLIALFLIILMSLGSVLMPFLISVVLAYLLQGSVAYFERRGLSHLLATVMVFVLFMGGLLASLFIMLPAIWQQLTQFFVELPRMAVKGQELMMLLPEKYPELISIEQSQQWTKQIGDELTRRGQWVLGFSLSGITGLMTILVYCVLVPILVFFMLKDSQQIIHWSTAFLPVRRHLLNRVWHEMDEQIANYIRGKVVEIIIVGGVSFVVFTLFGLKYSALLALAVGFSVLIPYIGAAVVTIPIALVAYVQWGWGNEFIWLMIVYFIIQALDGNVLVPLLFSEVVNLHPVAIILAVLIFGGLWGFWGVFFAIPLATLFKAVMQAWPTVVQEETPLPDA